MKKKELHSELKQLTHLGYITPEQLQNIQSNYLAENPKENSSRLLMLFALLGVIFMSVGFISIFAFNWSNFSRLTKSIVALIPLMTTQYLLYWAYTHYKSKVWLNSLTLALGFSYLLALGLIYQAYQLSYSLSSMLLITYLLMLPIIYLLDGYYLALLCIGGVYFFSLSSNRMDTLLIVLLVPYYVNKLKEGEDSTLLTLCYIGWILSLPFLFSLDNVPIILSLILLIFFTFTYHPLYTTISKCLIYTSAFIGAFMYDSLFSSLASSSNTLSFIMLLILLVILPFRWIRHPVYGKISKWIIYCTAFISIFMYESLFSSLAYSPDTLSFITILILLGIFAFRWLRYPQDTLDLSILCMISATLLFIPLFDSTWLYALCTNGVLLGLLIFKLVKGIHRGSSHSTRLAIALLNLYVIIRAFSMDISLLSKGICFILIGAGFFVSNYYITQKLGGDSYVK